MSPRVSVAIERLTYMGTLISKKKKKKIIRNRKIKIKLYMAYFWAVNTARRPIASANCRPTCKTTLLERDAGGDGRGRGKGNLLRLANKF